MTEFLPLLKKKDFSLLFFSQIFSQTGDRLQQMALIKLVFDMTGGESSESAMGLAKLVSFTIIPFFIIGPVAGVFVDRWDRRKTLYVCDFAKMVLMFLIPLLFVNFGSMIPIYLIIFLTYTASRFYVPAKLAIIPDLVEKDELLVANSLKSTTGMIAFVVGTLTGGIMVEQLGYRIGFMSTAITYGCGGFLLFLISKNAGALHLKNSRGQSIKRTVIQDLKEGYRYVMERKEIRFILGLMFVLLAAAGAVYIVFIVFIQDAFNTATQDLGILSVMIGSGLFTGALLYGKYGKKIEWHTSVFFCMVLGGAMVTAFALIVSAFPHLIIASILAIMAGLVIGPIFIAANTVIHLFSDQSMRGKLFMALDVVIHLGFLLTMFLSSYLSKFIPPKQIISAVGIMIVLIGVYGLNRYRNKEAVGTLE